MSDEAPRRGPSRRDLLERSAASLLGATFLPTTAGAAAEQPLQAPDSPPAGYNILFILVDQEHFFPEVAVSRFRRANC